MRIIDASHSETRFGGYPTFSRADVATKACDDAEAARLNALLARGAMTVYQIPQAPYTDKVQATEPDARRVANFSDYLVVLEATDRERTMLTIVADIAEEAQFFGVRDIGSSRPHAHWRYVEVPDANPREVALTEEEFSSLWGMVEAHWSQTIQVGQAYRAAYDAAQDAWQSMMR